MTLQFGHAYTDPRTLPAASPEMSASGEAVSGGVNHLPPSKAVFALAGRMPSRQTQLGADLVAPFAGEELVRVTRRFSERTGDRARQAGALTAIAGPVAASWQLIDVCPMATVRCAVGLPNVGAYGDVRVLMDLAQRAEGAGWDGVFIWDHVAYRERGWPVADPYVALAAIAATSVRVRLGVMVTALARRRPWKLAREIASLDGLSGGRIVVGVGLGSQANEEFAAFGEDPDLRVRAELVDEGLDILVGLLSGDPFAYRGRHYSVAETVFRPRPVQRPRPPIWIAGRWPATRPFQRAARFDGVFPTFRGIEHHERPTPDQLRAVVEYTRSQRDPLRDGFDVVLEAQSDGPDPGLVRDYEDAGLTWWIEKLGWFRGPTEFTRQRIEHGPP